MKDKSNSQSNQQILPKNVKTDKEVQPKYKLFSRIAKLLQIILPPFIWLVITSAINFVTQFVSKKIKALFKIKKKKLNLNDIINRRKFQTYAQYLKLGEKDLGFTNQVLYQQSKKAINFFIPTYVTCKIKSIQDVQVESLIANVSCTMIINIFYGDIPQEIVDKMQKSIVLQLNRGEALKLQHDGLAVDRKNDSKNKFLIFTLRKIFLASLKFDTLWAPFQIVELIVTITLNTVTVVPNQLKKKNEKSHFNQSKQYKVSFNCMRNSDKIPMSYAMDCVFGIYDLAQKRLETYSSKDSSYSEVIHNFQLHQEMIKAKKEKDKEKEKEKGKDKQKDKKKQTVKQSKFVVILDSPVKASDNNQIVERDVQQVVAESLTLIMQKNVKKQKKQPKKVKYYQYNHFIIPLYTYPGNAIASIFLPLFLLALVSLAIFFQEPELSGRVDAIATMVLGYISLIPVIKGQIAQSAQLTIVQSVVYIQTMCCLLCLYESFKIYYEQSNSEHEYTFVWNQNVTYMICLCTHISTFLFITVVYIVHKLIWEPSYNNDEKVIQQNPRSNRNKWINPYCDQTFVKYNKQLQKGDYTQQQKASSLIKVYQPFKDKEKEIKAPQIQQKNPTLKSVPSITQYDNTSFINKPGRQLDASVMDTSMISEMNELRSTNCLNMFQKKPSDPNLINEDEFFAADPQLYGKY